MKLLLLITFSIFIISSCGETAEQYHSECQKLDMVYRPNHGCVDLVQECIKGYIDTIDEKYNNPDIVQALREDEYSNVIKACKETFTPITK